jgi:hypothetical protein
MAGFMTSPPDCHRYPFRIYSSGFEAKEDTARCDLMIAPGFPDKIGTAAQARMPR